MNRSSVGLNGFVRYIVRPDMLIIQIPSKYRHNNLYHYIQPRKYCKT